LAAGNGHRHAVLPTSTTAVAADKGIEDIHWQAAHSSADEDDVATLF
jgi:hypothetical protein